MARQFLVGVDEAGRGPIAGPVAVAAVAVPARSTRRSVFSKFGRVRDSKRLSTKQREELFARIRECKKRGKLDFAVALVGEQMIDERGIVAAVKIGISRCLRRLGCPPAESWVLLDGALTAPRRYHRQKTIIRGDETEPLIALASIAAKVVRDRKMLFWAKRYPDYGFAQHKGYGTKKHYHALLKYDPTSLHRLSFLRRRYGGLSCQTT